MSNPRALRRPPTEAPRADPIQRLAAQFANRSRQLFRQQVLDYPDALAWQRLEYDVADLLERRFNDTLEPWAMGPALSKLNQTLAQTVATALFRDDPSQGREMAYRQAATTVYEKAANWAGMSDNEFAYWRHAALVWTTLWHASASRTITPAQLAGYLGFRAPAPSIPVPPPEPIVPVAPPAPPPAARAEKTFGPSRFGLSDRSVLAGNARLLASVFNTSKLGMAVGLAASVLVTVAVVCVGMFVFSVGSMNVIALLAGATSLPMIAMAAIGLVLYGWLVGGMLMKGASRRIADDMKLAYVEPEHPLQRRMEEMRSAIWFSRTPRVGIFPAEDINGFAVDDTDGGAVIGVSQAAVDQLSRKQMDALLAHELGHIVTGDMARMMFARCFQRSFTCWMGIAQVDAFACWALSSLGELQVLRLSRRREYWADAIGSAVAGKASMVALLKALENGQPRAASATKVAPELFFRDVLQRAFRTHPPINERIRAVNDEKHIPEMRLTYSE